MSSCKLSRESKENQKGKGPDWMFDLDLLTPSMNYIPVRKENYADPKEQGISCDDVEDLDDQQFIVHTAQPMHPEECTAAKEVSLSSEEQALHDELVSLMHIFRFDITSFEIAMSKGSLMWSSTAHSQRTASVQGTASFHGTASIPKSPNDY
ncbi:hypothetical protein Tco_0106986, partial [Tanacetum coccineum]